MTRLPRRDARRGGGQSPFGRPDRHRWPRFEARVLAIVFTGGTAGGLARYGMMQAWPTPVGAFPWATLLINIGGTFALSLLVAVLTEVGSPHPYLHPLIATGFLGAFTTFAAVTATVDQLAAHGNATTGAVYLVTSVLAALLAAFLGLLVGRAFGNRRHGQRSAR